MAIGDKYELTFHSTLLGVDMLNKFHYSQVTNDTMVGPPQALALAKAFDAIVLPALQFIQSTSVVYGQIEVANLTDLSDFASFPSTSTPHGNEAGDVLPPWVTASFIYHRASRDFRNGAKRFSGISEGDISGVNPSVPWLASAIGLSAILEGILAAPLITDGTWQPGYFGKRHSDHLRVFTGISGVSFNRVGSQNTRKH